MAKKDKAAEPVTAGDLQGNGRVSGHLLSFVERVERLNEEIGGLTEDRKEVLDEAKSMGFDAATLRKVIQRRKKHADDIAEADAMLDLYEDTIRRAEKAAVAQSIEEGDE